MKLARSKEVVERFRREGRAYARLRHEAIVQVHDLVEKDEGLYLVTEFVDGTDLSRLLAKGGGRTSGAPTRRLASSDLECRAQALRCCPLAW